MKWIIGVLILLSVAGCKPAPNTEGTTVPDVASVDKEPPKDFDGMVLQGDGFWVATRIVPRMRISTKANPGDSTNNQTVVLMFHRAGSNMHEYDPIAERIAKMGYDCLKVDQRSGGDMWGEQNVTKKQYASEQSYLDAYQDMVAVLKYAREEWARVIVWGSSYSASLVLRLAAEYPDDVAAVLSFSPGEYFEQPGLVASWNAKVKAPRFFAATSAEINGGVLEIYQAATDLKGSHLIGFSDGVHGSQTLREDECPERWQDYWSGVESFFQEIGETSP